MKDCPGMGEITFTTELQPRGNASAVVLTDAQMEIVGEGSKRPPVRATINGFSWRSRLARMSGENLLGLSRAIREESGVQIGDVVEVTVALDSEPREVVVPEVLAAALLDDPVAGAAFEALAYTHRKEFARWIEEAKKDETRQRRVVQALQMLRGGKTRS